MKDLNVGYWRATFHFYGIKDMVMSRLAAVKKAVNRACPRARLLSKLFEGKDGERVDNSMVPVEWQPSAAGIPSLRHAATIDFNLPTDGSGYGAHVDFSPILPHDGNWHWSGSKMHGRFSMITDSTSLLAAICSRNIPSWSTWFYSIEMTNSTWKVWLFFGTILLQRPRNIISPSTALILIIWVIRPPRGNC